MRKETQFQYVLKVGNVRRVVNPTDSKDNKITSAPEGSEIFFRRKLSGGLKFQNADAQLLIQNEQSEIRCQEAKLFIQRQCNGNYINYWQGAFSITDCKYDYDLGTVKIDQFVVDDAYRNILENWDKEYNILDVKATVAVNAKLDFRTNFEFAYYDTDNGIDSLDDADTWEDFVNMPYWISGSFPQGGTRSRANIAFRVVRTAPYTVNTQYPNGVVADLSGDGWQVVLDDPTAKIAKYAKKPGVYNFSPYRWGTFSEFGKYPDLIQVACGTPYDGTKYIKVTSINGPHSAECSNGCMNIREYVDERRCVDILWQYGTFSFTRNRRLIDVIYYLLQKTSPQNLPNRAEDLSTFLTSATNYVTNKTNKLIDMLIAQKSDIIAYKSSEAATKGLYSLKNLLEDLRKMLNVYWYIDDNGYFKLEHLSFFGKIGKFDLTLPQYERWARGTRNFEFNKLKMPQYERLIFSEAFNDDFAKGEIEYSGDCVNKREGENTAEFTISRIDNDIQGLFVSGGSNEGFVLLCHVNGQVINEAGELTGTILANGHLSAANLIANYYLDGRVLSAGLMNNKQTAFKSIVKTKKQADISFPYCCEDTINPFATFVTTLGKYGELASTELTIKDGVMKIAVLHDSEPDIYGPTPGRQFNQDFNPSFA